MGFMNPRSYPAALGTQVRDMMPELMRGSYGKPGPVPAQFSAVAFLESCDLDSNDWPEADLRGVIHYLRGSTRLFLPGEIKAAFPKRA